MSNNNIKKIYSFQVFTEQEIDKTEDSTNNEGEKITITKKVKEKVPQTYFIRRPTRTINEEATLYENVKYSEAIERKILPYFLLKKKLFKNDDIISDQEKNLDAAKKEDELNNEIENISKEYRHLKLKKEEELTPADKNKIRELEEQYSQKQLALLDFQTLRSNIWEKSAEAYARNKVVVWYMLFLAYKEENGENKEFFKGETLEDKLKILDAFENEDDPLNNSIVNKFLFYTAFWHSNQDAQKEDFDNLAKMFEDAERKNP